MILVSLLANPEVAWERHAALMAIDADEIVRRIGPCDGPIEVLAGGHANVTVRVGDDRVLRIYRRDPQSLTKERALLQRNWRTFRVPTVLADGDDFLVLDYVEHGPLEESPDCGAALGRALAEIHATTYPAAGLLGGDLTVATPFAVAISALTDHLQGQCERMAPSPRQRLGMPMLDAFHRHADRLREVAGPPVLLHGDFKVTNLHRTRSELPLVLDWEFAYAGPALMEIGQLMRWSPPEPWVAAFAAAYRDSGGHLPADWWRLADILDLVNLAGLLGRAEAGSRRERDLIGRIEATLSA
jgi:aminoglycoside phosphotransferase (APT) family kinase protein